MGVGGGGVGLVLRGLRGGGRAVLSWFCLFSFWEVWSEMGLWEWERCEGGRYVDSIVGLDVKYCKRTRENRDQK